MIICFENMRKYPHKKKWNDKFVIILIAFLPEGIFLSLMQQLHAFFY